ncbi:molybdopterin-dependent oxidoreductase, partial [Teichococcus cervicalis]
AREAPATAAAPVVLRVGGRIERPPQGEAAFTLAALEALGMRRLRTTTPWTQGAQEFSGVPLALLMRAVRPLGQRLWAEAINRYRAELPLADAWERDAFLATRRDGEPMRIRDRGPVWLVYPWTQRPELDIPLYHERAVWQLRRIEVS